MNDQLRTSRREISPETERKMHEFFARFAARPAAPETPPEASGDAPETGREG